MTTLAEARKKLSDNIEIIRRGKSMHTVQVATGDSVIIHRKGNVKASRSLAETIISEAKERTTGVSSRRMLESMRKSRG
ncbi:hypothetical protein LPB67_15465 [Undibacterium sp. Jales W-56]|uniref:hypothetical protein n=1 Tax=Undibacterium sp. Jales W-56 TaxID=2897325 RepID=UPI0021D3AA75|nr:hypothetical protein [Undibacterium sp. Jales W-56]MCU6435175.1 hypothetical protein [Undibacterium sp. Jales W-56]